MTDDSELIAAAKTADEALTVLFEAMRDIDRRDHRMMVTLREKYGLPQAMSKLAECNSDLFVLLVARFKQA